MGDAMPRAMPGALLHIRGLCRTFHIGGTAVEAVKKLNLSIGEGTFTAIVGHSGCGKTTLLRLISGLEKADAGTVTFDEGFSDKHGKGGNFGFMFQDARLLPWLSVEENLRLAFPPEHKSERKSARKSERKAAQDAEIEKLLRLVGLAEWKKVYPKRLSGGMAQRIALVRALCRKPRVLLLDEPFGALDSFTRSHLREEMNKLWASLNLTVLLVTHDIEEAVYLADKIILMKDGAVDDEITVTLPRPRRHRSPAFQELCRVIEEKMANI
jgi:ABC-type nitrate/sulfonate/bicarbonate transport system ATPase subunit